MDQQPQPDDSAAALAAHIPHTRSPEQDQIVERERIRLQQKADEDNAVPEER